MRVSKKNKMRKISIARFEIPKPNSHLRTAIKITWTQFAKRTSIHGVKYVNDPKGTILTKAIWICVCIACFVIANTLVSTFWSRYKSNPTRMNIETNHGSLQEVSFPAITFCSTNRISFLKAIKLVQTL